MSLTIDEINALQVENERLRMRVRDLRKLIGELHDEYIWGLSPCRELDKSCLRCRVDSILMDRKEYAALDEQGDADGPS